MMGDTAKNCAAGAGAGLGNVLCWAYDANLGLYASQVTLVVTAVAGAVFLLGQSFVKVWKLYLDTKLEADLARDKAMGPTISRQFESLQGQMRRDAEARATMARKLEAVEEEKHRMLLKLTETVEDNTAKIDTIKDAVATGPKVLIVEDERDASALMGRILKGQKYRVDFAGSVAEAISKLLSVPHFVILDVMIPGGSGFDVLREVRTRRMDTKVIICSALDHSDPSYAALAAELMPDFTLRKPPDLGLLIAYLQDISQPRPHLSDMDLPRLSGDEIPATGTVVAKP